MFINTRPIILMTGLLLMAGAVVTAHALTDAELEALEQQIEQQEAENKAKAAAEAKRKAEAKRQAQEAARQKAEEQRRAEEEARKRAEAEAKHKAEEAARSKAEQHTLAGEMVKIQGGTFQMGSNYVQPMHSVTIQSFEIGKYEVTQHQWQVVMGGNPSYIKNCDTCPVEQVSWDDVQAFLKALNQKTGDSYRLPTEAEWEYACRSGGRPEEYCGGNDADVLVWYDGNSGGNTHPVGQKQPNGLGLYDMSGNVWEWVEDCWNDNYSDAPGDGSAWTSGDCSRRVLRGGSYVDWAESTGSAHRFNLSRTIRDIYRGFRLARDL